ncbi:MAG: NifB/NifX family molybdenum-iron cluster-binding protein [Halarcobacter sp.]
MIAIPLSDSTSTTISDLYGNASFFALLDSQSGSFSVIENKGCGNGLDTAKYVIEAGAKSTIFYHMGEGVYKHLNENKIKVYSSSKVFLTLEDIYNDVKSNSCKEVTLTNYESLLDPGTPTGSCECSSN